MNKYPVTNLEKLKIFEKELDKPNLQFEIRKHCQVKRDYYLGLLMRQEKAEYERWQASKTFK